MQIRALGLFILHENQARLNRPTQFYVQASGLALWFFNELKHSRAT